MKFRGPESRGSLGDETYARNRGGQYVRSRNGRGGSGSPAMAAIVAGWQGLTDAERQLWIDAATQETRVDSLGQVIGISGFDLFMGANLQTGGLTFLVPSFIERVPLSCTVEFVGSSLIATTVHDAQVSVQWRSSGVVTPGTMSAPGRGLWWKIFWGAGYLGSGSPTEDLTTPWAAVFGAWASGDYFFVEERASLRGRWTWSNRFRLQVP